MARRTLSTRGRILTAGISVAVGGALVGFMAVGDHSSHATDDPHPTTSAAHPPSGDPSLPSSAPQPMTRTGGS